jgi:abortive infection bacteriophage resistance protein
MKRDDQRDVADLYGISIDSLMVYLPILANFRNLCAHEDIMYDHRTQRTIEDTKYHAYLNIPKTDGEYIYGKDDLFGLIIILKQLLSKSDFTLLINELSYELDILDGKIDTIELDKILDRMGIPHNFREIARMD